MTNNPVGMGEQDRSERDKFENELKRILKASVEAGNILRVIGSLAFQMHCPNSGYLQAAMRRAYTDIDFAAYGKQLAQGYCLRAPQQKIKVTTQVGQILARLNSQPKSVAWRIRDRVGERVKWYKELMKFKEAKCPTLCAI